VIGVDQLLKVSDVAGILNVSDDRVYTLAREQIIPTVRVGRSLRFSYKALNEFIARGGKALPGIWKHEN
jgi:excisionase family DNA binding protein